MSFKVVYYYYCVCMCVHTYIMCIMWTVCVPVSVCSPVCAHHSAICGCQRTNLWSWFCL